MPLPHTQMIGVHQSSTAGRAAAAAAAAARQRDAMCKASLIKDGHLRLISRYPHCQYLEDVLTRV